MKALNLKINKGIQNISIFNYDIERILPKFIFWSFGVIALFYIFFLGNMVFDIVERRSLEANARILSNEVRDLELTYLSMTNDIDLPHSYLLGFKETKAVFATRKSLGYRSSGGPVDIVKVVQNDL